MNDLYESIMQLGTLLQSQVSQNVSFHSQSDYIELSKNPNTDRSIKFPAIIIRGPRLDEYEFGNEIFDQFIINETEGTFVRRPSPKIYDAYFKMIVISEGDIEGLETISKLITFFSSNNQITANEKVYNMILNVPISDSGDSNMSDLSKYEGTFRIEGIEFAGGVDQVGKIVKDVNVQLGQL